MTTSKRAGRLDRRLAITRSLLLGLITAQILGTPAASAQNVGQCPADSHQARGEALLDLGEVAEAQSAFEAALALAKADANVRAEAAALDGLGMAAAARGRILTAERRHVAAADAFAGIGDRSGQARALYNYGLAALQTAGAGDGDWLSIARGRGLSAALDPALSGAAAERLSLAGDVALEAGEFGLAAQSFALAARAAARSNAAFGASGPARSADLAASQVGDPLMRADAAAAALDAALFAAVVGEAEPSLIESATIAAIAAADASGDGERQAIARGLAARAYALAGRVDDALDLSRQAVYLADEAGALELRALWLGQAGAFAEAAGRIDGARAFYADATDTLQSDRSGLRERDVTVGRSGFAANVMPILDARSDLLLRLAPRGSRTPEKDGALEEARRVIEIARAIEIELFAGDPCVRRGLSSDLDDLPSGTGVLYPVVLEDRVEILFGTNAGVIRGVSDRSPVEVAELASAYREALAGNAPPESFRELGRALYDAILGPVAAGVEAQGANTLLYAPDGPTREAPLSAFIAPDDRFVAETYGVATVLSLSLVDPTQTPDRALSALIGGVTESVEGYDALPAVAREVEAVAEAVAARTLVDDAFTREALSASLEDASTTIVHLATHGDFRGSSRKSFVLGHDGPIYLDQLTELAQRERVKDTAIDLLTLSACQTAAGDDAAVMGLAGAAFASGAETVVGALWQVSDESTAELFKNFYVELARQEAQGVQRDKAAALVVAQRAAIAAGRHPFEWSAFVLIGKWL